MDLWVLSFSLIDDLQDPVCYDIKLVLIVDRLVSIGNTHPFVWITSDVAGSEECK